MPATPGFLATALALAITAAGCGTPPATDIGAAKAAGEKAAADAVRQWEYKPSLLTGAPVPAVMTVTINFKLQ
jgi:hypothetical protein